MNAKPTTQITAAAGAAAVTTVIAWAARAAGVEVPGDVQGAITTILVLVAGYLVGPSKKGDHAAD